MTAETAGPPRLGLRQGLVVGLLVLPVCGLSCAALALAGYWAPAAGVGSVVSACAGYTVTGPFHIGVNWIAPWMSSLPSIWFDRQVCGMLPWPPFFPPVGAVAFPP